MEFILSTALSYLLLYKYAALFVIGYLAALFLPLPSDSTVLAAGAFASQGYFNIYLVLIFALAGNILGDATGFFIARRYGREFLMKVGFRRLLESKKFTNVEKFIADNSGPTIFLTRFVGQLGPLVNILCGLSEMPYKKFFLYESLGEFADVVALGLAGYFLGSGWQNLTETLTLVGIGIIIVIIAFIFFRIYFRSIRHQI